MKSDTKQDMKLQYILNRDEEQNSLEQNSYM